MMERYYDAHLYLTNWGTHQVMLRLPRVLLSLETAEQYCIDPHVTAWTSGEHLILDLISEDESGDWVEGAEDSLSAIVSVRTDLAAGDLRPLYLAWLAAYGTWERDEGGRRRTAGRRARRCGEHLPGREHVPAGRRQAPGPYQPQQPIQCMRSRIQCSYDCHSRHGQPQRPGLSACRRPPSLAHQVRPGDRQGRLCHRPPHTG